MRLTVTADQAISRALAGAGDTLANAVLSHETQFAAALSEAQQALSHALNAAIERLASSIQITVPVHVDSKKLTTATVQNIRQQSVTRGASYVTLT